MDEPSAEELAAIRRLAANPVKIDQTSRVKYDLMRFHLTIDDICDQIVDWIDAKKPVKKVIMREAHAGQVAYELLPRINEMQFYIKVMLIDLCTIYEHLLVISAHESVN
jgi:hypothetical protein